MSCPNRLGEDGDGARCGDEGRLCSSCEAELEREWSWLARASKYTVLPIDEEYRQEMRDAGRGHLLPE